VIQHLTFEEELMNELFRKFSNASAERLGSPWAFILGLGIILVWGITGPLFDFSDSWQLVINTGTSLVTFLMVFLIQSTQNRDTRAMQLKLDELLRAVSEARTRLVALEDSPDEEIENLKQEFTQLKEACPEDEGKPEPVG
jgi:low affinity Fe/Cu permease